MVQPRPGHFGFHFGGPGHFGLHFGGGYFGLHFAGGFEAEYPCSVSGCEAPPCQALSDGSLRVRPMVRGPTVLDWDLRTIDEIRSWPGPIEVAIDYSRTGNRDPDAWTEYIGYTERPPQHGITEQLSFGSDFNLHFRLRVRSATGDILATRPVSWFDDVPIRQRPIYLELTRRWSQRGRTGELRPGILLKRRRWGERCTVCRDRDGGQQIKTQCLACYDTGFTGGYYLDRRCFYADQGLAGLSTKFDFTRGYSQTGPVALFEVLNIPHVFPGDVWVNTKTDERWGFGSPMNDKVRVGNVQLFRSVPGARFDTPHVIYRFPIE